MYGPAIFVQNHLNFLGSTSRAHIRPPEQTESPADLTADNNFVLGNQTVLNDLTFMAVWPAASFKKTVRFDRNEEQYFHGLLPPQNSDEKVRATLWRPVIPEARFCYELRVKIEVRERQFSWPRRENSRSTICHSDI
jgi:hypothetical protein